MDQEKVYVDILLTTLKKKEVILKQLLALTEEQEQLLKENEFQEDKFMELIEKKKTVLFQLNKLDFGFETVYTKVKEELAVDKEQYRLQIESMQQYIAKIIDLSMKLTALEQRNKFSMERYFINSKKKIKDTKLSSQTVSNYYKNMTGVHQGHSYFMDQKK